MEKKTREAFYMLFGVLFCLNVLIGCSEYEVVNSESKEVSFVTGQAEERVTPEIGVTVEPTATSEPTVIPEPTATPQSTAIPEPTVTSEPIVTPDPTAMPDPIVTLEPTVTPKPTVTPEPTVTLRPTATPVSESVKGITENDYIEFGSYPKEILAESEVTTELLNADYDVNGMTTVNGKKYARVNKEEIEEKKGSWLNGGNEITYYEFQPLEWLVLEVKDGKAFLLSRYIIDGQPFDSACPGDVWIEDPETYNKYNATWETCSLRGWLNNEFFYTAFNEEEQANILLAEVKNKPNSLRGRSSGADTKDRIYLLSEEEVLKYLDKELITGYTPKTMPEDTRHCGLPTSFALRRGAYQKNGKKWYSTFCEWTLRTAGGMGITSTVIRQPGFLDLDGWDADFYMGIRPCMWIDLETAEVKRSN